MRPGADIIDPPFRSGTYSSRTIVIAFRETELVETHLLVAYFVECELVLSHFPYRLLCNGVAN